MSAHRPHVAAALLITALVTLAAWQTPYSILMWAMPLVCVLLTRILFPRRGHVPIVAALPVIAMLVLWRAFDFGAYVYSHRVSLGLGRQSAIAASWCLLSASIFASALLGTYLRGHSRSRAE